MSLYAAIENEIVRNGGFIRKSLQSRIRKALSKGALNKKQLQRLLNKAEGLRKPKPKAKPPANTPKKKGTLEDFDKAWKKEDFLTPHLKEGPLYALTFPQKQVIMKRHKLSRKQETALKQYLLNRDSASRKKAFEAGIRPEFLKKITALADKKPSHKVEKGIAVKPGTNKEVGRPSLFVDDARQSTLNTAPLPSKLPKDHESSLEKDSPAMPITHLKQALGKYREFGLTNVKHKGKEFVLSGKTVPIIKLRKMTPAQISKLPKYQEALKKDSDLTPTKWKNRILKELLEKDIKARRSANRQGERGLDALDKARERKSHFTKTQKAAVKKWLANRSKNAWKQAIRSGVKELTLRRLTTMADHRSK